MVGAPLRAPESPWHGSPCHGRDDRAEHRPCGHTGRRDRFGEPLIEHVERVAATVPDDARATAYLHDVLEHSDTTVDELEGEGLTRSSSRRCGC